MSNIWEFFLQTLSISIIALFILLLKKIFEDKLPPSWQYGIWGILFLKMLLPTSITHYVFINLPLEIEILKSNIESHLSSTYSNVFSPLSLYSPFPWINQLPRSFTDILFVIYVFGFHLSLLYYIFSYLKLKRKLKKGTRINDSRFVSFSNHEIIQLPHLEGAFVCGIFHPVLVVGDIELLDEKILLHEALHMRYKDNLQNVTWAFFRCLHWCNPFLQYVFNIIGNDMEALCDHRVLELLKGEERRQYGYILLNMANHTYSRTPGTTSISNGGKNIAKRIQTIARFKKYPSGMEIVSICMLIALFSPLFVGNASATTKDNLIISNTQELKEVMARTRINRAQTVASALDIYAKGIVEENGMYLALTTPLENQQHYFEAMQNNPSYNAHYYKQYPNIDFLDSYQIINLKENDDHSYQAILAFQTTNQTYALLPVSIINDGSWIVEATGDLDITNYPYFDWSWMNYPLPDDLWTDDYFKDHRFTHRTERGTYRIRITEKHLVHTDNTPIDLNAIFNETKLLVEFEYVSNTPSSQIENAAMQMDSLNDLNQAVEKVDFISTSGGGYNGTTTTHTRQFSNSEDWNGIFSLKDFVYSNKDIQGLYVQIQVNGEIVDDFIIKRSDWSWENN